MMIGIKSFILNISKFFSLCFRYKLFSVWDYWIRKITSKIMIISLSIIKNRVYRSHNGPFTSSHAIEMAECKINCTFLRFSEFEAPSTFNWNWNNFIFEISIQFARFVHGEKKIKQNETKNIKASRMNMENYESNAIIIAFFISDYADGDVTVAVAHTQWMNKHFSAWCRCKTFLNIRK